MSESITRLKETRKLLLFPFGGNAKEILAFMLQADKLDSKWKILGFIDDDPGMHGKHCCGISVIGDRSYIDKYPDIHILAVPGNPKSYLNRKHIINSLRISTERFATLIHPTSVIAPDVQIGYNTAITPNVVIGHGTIIGNHCVILPNTVIAHDSIVGHYCCIGSNVTVSGHVRIGMSSYIASGVKIRDHLSIGTGSMIGIGSNVISNIGDNICVAGNPAKEIKVALQ